MTDRSGIFAGEDPFHIFKDWLAEAAMQEPNDPNAIALSTVDANGLPNARVVLLKDVEDDAFVFYTNFTSQKAQELDHAGKAAFVIHWKSLRRQIRVRGGVSREEGAAADAYFQSRSVASRRGAWASDQSSPLNNRSELMERARQIERDMGAEVPRPPFWGGFRLKPIEIEFWADGPARLHDRFRWTREGIDSEWKITRLHP